MLDLTRMFDHYEPAAYIPVGDLKPGDLVLVTPEGNQCPGIYSDHVDGVAVVLELTTRFNGRFQPVRFSIDPHYAMDIGTDLELLACRWRLHGVRDMLGRDQTEIAFLAGRNAA